MTPGDFTSGSEDRRPALGRALTACVLFFLLSSVPAAGEEKAPAADAVAKLKASRARSAAETAVKCANAKCFYAAFEYLKLAESMDSGIDGLARIREYLSFLKPLSWRNLPKPPTPSVMPESAELAEKGHAAQADCATVAAFWKTGLDRFLSEFLDDLDGLVRKSGASIPAGEAYMTVAGMSELVPSWGQAKAPDRARESLLRLGFRFGTYRHKWPRWLNPAEAAEAAALEAFEKERDARVVKALGECRRAAELRQNPGASEIGAALGLKGPRFASAHFEMEGLADSAAAETLAGLFEKGLSEAARLAGKPVPASFDPPVRILILAGDEEFGRFVDGIAELEGESKAAVRNQGMGYADPERSAFAFCGEAGGRDFHASCLLGALKLGFDRLGMFNLPLWLWAGLSDTVSATVLGAVAPSLGFERPKTEQEFDPWFDHFSWKKSMAQEAGKGRNPSVQTVLGREGEFEIPSSQRVMMACLAAFLLGHAQETGKALEALAKEGWKQDPKGGWNALAAAGWTAETFEKEWKGFMVSSSSSGGR